VNNQDFFLIIIIIHLSNGILYNLINSSTIITKYFFPKL